MRRLWTLGMFMVALWPMMARSAVPIEPAVKVLVRVLSYDRNLGTRAPPGALRIGIVYDASAPLSADQASEAKDALEALLGSRVGTRTLGTPVMLPSREGRWSERIGELGAILLCRGTEAALSELLAASKPQQIPLLTLEGNLVRDGVAIGVALRQARLSILVDVGAARASGLDLSAEVLQLAEAVGP